MYVQLLHAGVNLFTRCMLAVDVELVRLRSSVEQTLDDEVGLTLWTLELDLDVALFGANLHKGVDLVRATQDLWQSGECYEVIFIERTYAGREVQTKADCARNTTLSGTIRS